MGRFTRFLNVFRRGRLERDIDAELAFHADMRARELEAKGLAPAVARREAERRLGNRLALRDRTRDVDVIVWLETTWLDAQNAARALVRAPAFTIAAVMTLALGIGANTAIFGVVYGILLRPLPYPDPGSLYLVFQTSEAAGRTRAAPLDFLDWRERTRTFENLAAHAGMGFTLTDAGDPELVIGQLVSAELFETLGVRPVLGRGFHPDENEVGRNHVLVLSHGLWERRFGGDPRVIGRTITANAKAYTVVGVMPPGFAYPSSRSQLWAPFPFRGTNTDNLPINRESRYLQIVGRLRAGVTAEQAASDMDAVARSLAQQFPDTHRNRGIDVVSLVEETVGDVRRAVWLVFAGATLVLLIACSNVTSLLLARFSTREHELGVRVALGASRLRLLRQFFVETVVLYGVGGIVGVLLAYWLLKLIVALAPADLPRVSDLAMTAPVLGFAFLAGFATALLFGLAPAWHALLKSSGGLTDALTGRRTTTTAREQHTRSVVLTGQIAVAVLLLTGAGLAGRSLLNLQRVPKGFDPNHAMTFNVVMPAVRFPDASSMRAFYHRLLDHFESHPLFEAVGVTTHLPLSGQDLENGFRVAGYVPRSEEETPVAGLRGVSPGYVAAMGIPVRRGRNLTAADGTTAPPVVLVNDSFVRRYWPGSDPISQQVSMGDSDPWRTVVGVVADVKHRGLATDPRPEVLMPYPQLEPGFMTSWARGLSVVVRSHAAPDLLLSAVRQEMRRLDPLLPVITPKEMTDLVSEALGQPRFRTFLLASFALLAFILALVGTFGLLSYVVTRRRQEIGVRMALGATPRDVVRDVLGYAMRVVATGLAIGAGAALLLTRSMGAVLYDVPPHDPMTLSAAIVLLGLSGVASCYWPARRAAQVDPAVALRSE